MGRSPACHPLLSLQYYRLQVDRQLIWWAAVVHLTVLFSTNLAIQFLVSLAAVTLAAVQLFSCISSS